MNKDPQHKTDSISSYHADPMQEFLHWYQLLSGANRGRTVNFLRKIFQSIVGWIIPPLKDFYRPDAITLATASKQGRPSARIVLFKGIQSNGFTFFTSYAGRKARELEENPYACMVFHQKFPPRQIRIEGKVSKLERHLSEKYWSGRAVNSQLGAMAGHQSQVIESPEVLNLKVHQLEKLYKNKPIPCPEYWGGYVLIPDRYEFWTGKAFRIHHRVEYKLVAENTWEKAFLAP